MKRIKDGYSEPILIAETDSDELYAMDANFNNEQDGEVTGRVRVTQEFFDGDGDSWVQPFTLYTDRIDATLNSRYEGERFIDLKQDPYLYVRFDEGVDYSKTARVNLDKFIIESYYGDKVGYDETRGLIYPTHVNDSKQLKNNNMKRVQDSGWTYDTIDYRGYTIKIEYDNDYPNPFEEWDEECQIYNVGHRNFGMGKDIGYGFETDDEAREYFGDAYYLPFAVNGYDDSCYETSVDRADGFLVWERAAFEHLGTSNTPEQDLKNSLKLLNDYATGKVFGFIIERPKGGEIDSCWGFFGEESIDEMIAECKSTIDTDIEKKEEYERGREDREFDEFWAKRGDINDSRKPVRSLTRRIKDSVKMKTIRKKITDAKEKFFNNDLKRMQAFRRVTDSEGKINENVVFLIEDSDVLAVFPNTYGTANRDRDTMVCYSHNGQHGVCTYDYANTLKTADSKQYNELKDELANYVGYNLTIVDSLPSETELKQHAKEIRDSYIKFRRGIHEIDDARMLARGEEIEYKGRRGTVQYALFHGKEPVVIRWTNEEGSEEFEIPYNQVNDLKIHDSEDDTDVNVEPVDSDIDENEVTDGCGGKKGKKKTTVKDNVKKVKIFNRNKKSE